MHILLRTCMLSQKWGQEKSFWIKFKFNRNEFQPLPDKLEEILKG